jgi:hypothetical protein
MMKKILALSLAFIVIAAGCGTPEDLGTSKVNVTQNPSSNQGNNQAGSNDPCNNDYYPVVNGATWTYLITVQEDEPTTTIYTMAVNQDDTFTLNIQDEDSKFTLDGSCNDEGIVLLNVPGVSSTYSGQDGNGSSMTTITNEGVTLPDDVQEGDEWSQTISVNATSGESGLSATIETNYKAIGFENVTVPAGTFNALKVEQTGSMIMEGTPAFETHGFIWYVEGVGTVKSGLDGTYTGELVSYNIP